MSPVKDTLKLLGIAFLLSFIWFSCAHVSSCTTSPQFHLALLLLTVLVIFLSCVLIFTLPVYKDFSMNLLLVILTLCLFCIDGFLFVSQNIFSLF